MIMRFLGDKLFPVLFGTLCSIAVPATINLAQSITAKDRLFFTQMQRRHTDDKANQSTIITITNPMRKDLYNITIKFTPTNQTAARIIEHAEDGDFYNGDGKLLGVKNDDLGKVILKFQKFPKDSRFSIFVANGGEYQIGNKENSARAYVGGRAIEFTKTPGLYYRRFKYEPYYYLALGVAGGVAAVLGYRWLTAWRGRKPRQPRALQASSQAS